jgi:hypothetical protein
MGSLQAAPRGRRWRRRRQRRTGDCARVTPATLGSRRHHRRGPRPGNGVLRRAGAWRPGPEVHGGRVRRHRHRHLRLPQRDRHAAAARRRRWPGAAGLGPARPPAWVSRRDVHRTRTAPRGVRGERPSGGMPDLSRHTILMAALHSSEVLGDEEFWQRRRSSSAADRGAPEVSASRRWPRARRARAGERSRRRRGRGSCPAGAGAGAARGGGFRGW